MESIIATVAEFVDAQSWLAFPAAFFGGIVSSAGPCVLAMIPLIMGYVGAYSEGSQKKAIQYSLVFVLGLTITFTVLGVIAGTLGRLFGDVGFFWYYVLPPVAILMGLYLIFSDKLNISIGLPQKFMPKKKALLGAFLMGLFFGIVASPCATPILAVILTFAAARQDVAFSAGLLLSYALGYWVLVLGAGISVGFAQKALASKGISNFSSYSKKIGGILLISVGVWLIITNLL